ncbi:MAG TPA: GDP-mannose 4,6-dehydratase [Candidatus Margulisiibacteriota bacterium]|nr:GDP-mannose 4,6-dehydratase [Candidatus Margulisiibacteriota bacterium]
MRFLITGVSGFAGRTLARQLLADGHDVFGTTRGAVGARSYLPLAADHVLVAGLDDVQRLTHIVGQIRPEGLFHLAAFTSPAASFENPEAAYRSNLHGSLNLFAAVRAAATDCRIVWVGSSDAYGYVEPAEVPITESTLFRPLSPYAVSKAAADLAAYQWSRAHALDVVRMRPFNHTGPGQDPQFVCADFARQLVAIERGQRPARVEVGNLDVTRDFSDVRDVTRAYTLAWKHGSAGEAYNVCSGAPRTTRDILDALIRLSRVKPEVVVRPERQRRVDVPLLVGSAVKLRAATGWAPVIDWEQTLRDVLDDWRCRLDASTGLG